MKLQDNEFKGNGFHMLVKERAHELGLTLTDIANGLDVCKATLDNWTNFRNPSAMPEHKMMKLSEILNIDVDVLTRRYNEARSRAAKGVEFRTVGYVGNCFQVLIRERAGEVGLSLADLAVLCDVKTTTMYNWTSLHAKASKEKFKILAEALNIDEKTLLDCYNKAYAEKIGIKEETKEEPKEIIEMEEKKTSNVLVLKKNLFSEAVTKRLDAKNISITKVCTTMMISQKDLYGYLNLEVPMPNFRVEKLARIIGMSQEKLAMIIARAMDDGTETIIEDILKCDEYLRNESKEVEDLMADGLTIGDYTYRYEGLCYAILKQGDNGEMLLKVLPVIVIPNQESIRAIIKAEEWTIC